MLLRTVARAGRPLVAAAGLLASASAQPGLDARAAGIFPISRLEIRAAAAFTPCGMQALTLFVSSPGDVRDERQAVGRIVERLQARYWNFIRLEPVLWEKEPLRTAAHFNEDLIRPSDCDLFVGILWSWLGSPLPSQFNRKDGTRFDSGTEWELEEATDAYEERAAKKEAKAKPDILVYRRMSEPPPGGDEGAKRAQKKKLEAFCERFFFNPDKTIRRAFSPYETVDEFAALFEQHLEKLLLRHIRLQRGLAEDAVRPLPLEGSPFKGLGVFDYDDAPLFFGRNRPIAEALAKLKENHAAGHAFLLIYGGSGYGKSSLMRAGLAPRLTADGYLPDAGAWCGTTVLPVEGDGPPLETLARAIVEALPELAKLRDTSREPQAAPKGKKGRRSKTVAKAAPHWDSARLARTLGNPEQLAFAIAAIVAALDRLTAAKPAHFLLLVDQLEEIFTAKDVTAEMRDAFFHVLAALAMSRRVWVVATMRSEFFPRVPEHRDLFQLVRHGGGYILSPPELSELHQIIRYPVLAAGLQFERHPETGRDLSEQIYQDMADAHGALPLLEFTLEEIYQRRRDNVLTWSAYEELGGLAGAIARRAQETFDALPSDTRREAAKRIFGELVALDVEGPTTRLRAKRAGLEESHPGAPAFLTAFIGAKLLVTGSENNVATVTLAHEALITHWPVLRQWIDDHRDLLLARRRLEEATRLWNDGRRSPKFLLTDGRLAEADRVAASGVFRLGEDESELVRLSRIRARRKLRLFHGATAAFAALAVAAGGFGVMARNKRRQAEAAEDKANAAAAETRRSLAAADFDAGAARVEEGSPDEALPYLLAALESNPRNLEAQALLLETLRGTAWHFPAATLKHPLPLRVLSFGAEAGSLFAGIDTSSSSEGFNTTLRWDLGDLSIGAVLSPQWGQITQMLSVSPGAKHAVVQRDDKRIGPTFLCDAESLRVIARLPVSHKFPVTCFAWSPDGLLLAYPANPAERNPAKSSPVWRIVDAATGRTIREFPANAAPWCAAQLDRTRLRAVAEDGTLFEMPLHPDEPAVAAKADGRFSFAVFSPDGGQLLAAAPADEEDAEFHRAYRVENGSLGLTAIDLADAAGWANARGLAERFPWTRRESPVWERLFARPGEIPAALHGSGSRLTVAFDDAAGREPVAPVRADSQIECAALSGNYLATGTATGLLEIREVLPLAGRGLPAVRREAEEDDAEPGWSTRFTVDRFDVQLRGRDWRLLEKDGRAVPLQPHPGWDRAADVAVSRDGSRVVLAGYSSRSGGFSPAGLVMADSASGARLTGLEPVAGIRSVGFLGDGHRLAALGATEVLVAEAGDGGFRRLAAIPVVDALAVHYLESRDLIGVATAGEVSLFDGGDFSRVATLPVGGARPGGGDWGESAHGWAWDDDRGWLAYQSEGRLTVWSLASRRALISGVKLPAAGAAMDFAEKDGRSGLSFTGAFEAFLPLARTEGLDAGELAALRAMAESVSGTAFAAGTHALSTLDPAARRERAKQADLELLEKLLPGSRAILERLAAIESREAAPAAWLPVWQRLANGEADAAVARWASSLGEDHPWLQAYLRGLIGKSDRTLYRLRRDPSSVGDELPGDEEIAHFHRLAGDDGEIGALKQAAWLALRTGPEVAGKALAGERTKEDYPDLDHEALARLEPEAVEALRAALGDADQRDWRRLLLDDLGSRPAALELLADHEAATLAAYESEPSPARALRHAEALALGGKPAAAFLDGKLPDGFVPSLAEAHFLLAAGADAAGALDVHGSPWLWIAWLENAGPGDLAERVERTMTAVGGRGPAAVAALERALGAGDAAAIAATLLGAEDLPVAVREHATARALWLEGRKAEVFSLWPGGFPNYRELAENSELLGWERLLLGEEADAFFRTLEDELAALAVKPGATVEDLRTLAERLLDPATAATFGVKRVRDAMVACALALSDDAGSADAIAEMVESARLAGAPLAECLRIEARSLMAQGDFTAGYGRWLQLLESGEGGIISSDYLEAAQCVFEDLQNAAAIELLFRGKDRFPADADYAFDASWMLLTAMHPEQAGVMLEHGFAIPFTGDHKPTATAMLLCAAEQTGRSERADVAFLELLGYSPEWGDEESVKSLEWPESLEQILLSVAERNRAED